MSLPNTYVLGEGRVASDCVALGEAGPTRWGAFSAQVAALSARLGAFESALPGARVLVACGDRYHVAVALLACWSRQLVAVLTPGMQPAVLSAAARAHAVVLTLSDGEAEGLDVRPLLDGARGEASCRIELPADRVLVRLSTSGSTGDAVSIDKTAGQLLGEAHVLAATFGQPTPTAVLCTVPARHIYGLLFGVLWPLRLGVPFVRGTALLPDEIAELSRKHGADVLVAVPAHLATAAGLARHTHAIGRVFSSGAPLPNVTWDALRGVGLQVTEVLGSTETGGIAFHDAHDAPFTPFAGITVSADDEGRMSLRSGYLDPREPQPRVADDHIELLADGRFRWLGRHDGVVKVGGTRVSLAMIEARAKQLPGVTDAAALVVETSSARGQAIWLAVAAGGEWDAAGLRQALGQWFEHVVLPRRYRIVSALPREDSGKLTRARLLALFDEGPTKLPDLHGFVVMTQHVEHEPPSARLRLHVPRDLVYFRGHFDGHAILPGVVQLQSIVTSYARVLWPDVGMPIGARRVKFTRTIQPGEQIEVSLSRARADRVDFKLTVGGEACAAGTLLFATEPAS